MIRTAKPLFVYDGVRGLTLTIVQKNVYKSFPRKTLVCIESAGVVSGYPRQRGKSLIIKKKQSNF